MAIASLMPLPKYQAIANINGVLTPINNGYVYCYIAGTTTLKDTYTTADGTTPNANPVRLNSRGEASIFLGAGAYDIKLCDASNNEIWKQLNVRGSATTRNFATYAENVANSGLIDGEFINVAGYDSAGDGGEITMYWSSNSTATHNQGTVRKPTAVSGAGRWLACNPDVVYVKQFGAKGDGITDDTAAINYAISAAISSVVFHPGVYVHGALTISKRVMFLGMRGTKSGANVWPRLFLKSGTNADGITITTTGVLYADKIDFWGNKAGQSSASSVIMLTEDTSGSYVGANALFFTDCVVREGYSKGINCNKNRNGGRLLNTLILNCDDANFILFGSDWYCNFSEFGSAGGANVYTNFGASNDFVLCDFYYSGQNASYGSSKSNVYVGSSVNALTIANCQINSAYHHGIECADSVASGHYSFTSNQFGGNGLAAANTYSNIQIGAAKAAIKGNVHWDFGQKPKYLIETIGSAARVDFDDVYVAASYVTAVTNDETKVFNRSDVNGMTLGDGGYYQSRKSANDRILKFYTSTDANERFSIDGQGICRWGAGGGSATDVALLRGTANVLALAADDCFKTGLNTTANRPSAASVGAGSQFYDTTLSKPIWSDGAVWRDGAGTAV